MGRFAVAPLAALLILALPASALGAGKLTERQALKKTAQIARDAAESEAANGAVSYVAFGCRRSSQRSGVCWGGVIYGDNSACAQQVKVKKSRRGRISGRRYGRIVCGDLPADSDGDGKVGSGSGEGTAICAIRQSVCI